jgi:hypothetical protein
MPRLLIDEYPLIVLPSLAKLIGLHEAIMLQQIHYWISNPKNDGVHDGRRWVYNSTRQWQEQVPFMSESQIWDALKSLERGGLVVVGNYNKSGFDRTKWYSIDYDIFNLMMETEDSIADTDDPISATTDTISATAEMDSSPSGNGFPPQPRPIPESTQKIHIESVYTNSARQVAREAKQRDREAKKAKQNGAQQLVDSWPVGQLAKVKNFTWAYLRGISPDGKTPNQPDAVAMLAAMEHVLDIGPEYTPGDFEEACRYLYRSWGMKFNSVKSFRAHLAEWDAKGRPKWKQVVKAVQKEIPEW